MDRECVLCEVGTEYFYIKKISVCEGLMRELEWCG